MSPHLRLASLLVKFWFGKRMMNVTNWIVSHLLSSQGGLPSLSREDLL
jgi:hypothetical protein